jgi:hypothetical protein
MFIFGILDWKKQKGGRKTRLNDMKTNLNYLG